MDHIGGARMREISVGTVLPAKTYLINRQTLLNYANASGDQNPIHQDEAFAKSVGLPDVIAHGMLTMALTGRYVTEWAHGSGFVKEFSTRFTKPVIVPADKDVAINVSGVIAEASARTVVLELVVESGGAKVLGMTRAMIALM